MRTKVSNRVFLALGVSGRGGTKSTGRVARRAAVWRLGVLFMVFFVLHVGVEAGTGGWETAHLVALGWPARSSHTFWRWRQPATSSSGSASARCSPPAWCG